MAGLLLELHYFPSIWFFSELLEHQTVYLEACTNYQKTSYRNRCYIAAANGPLRLSIPLKKGKNKGQAYTDVQISYDVKWQHQHWQSIRSAYGNTPFFEHYADEIEPFFKQEYASLFNYNFDILTTICKLLSLDISFKKTTEFSLEAPKNFLDLRNQIRPNIDFKSARPYPQLFEDKHGFLPNLSILDLLFCCGPAAILYLEKNE